MENDDDREFTRFGRRSREGEIPKITAPDSQKQSSTEGRKMETVFSEFHGCTSHS